jgi:hypothetical protein
MAMLGFVSICRALIRDVSYCWIRNVAGHNQPGHRTLFPWPKHRCVANGVMCLGIGTEQTSQLYDAVASANFCCLSGRTA